MNFNHRQLSGSDRLQQLLDRNYASEPFPVNATISNSKVTSASHSRLLDRVLALQDERTQQALLAAQISQLNPLTTSSRNVVDSTTPFRTTTTKSQPQPSSTSTGGLFDSIMNLAQQQQQQQQQQQEETSPQQRASLLLNRLNHNNSITAEPEHCNRNILKSLLLPSPQDSRQLQNDLDVVTAKASSSETHLLTAALNANCAGRTSSSHSCLSSTTRNLSTFDNRLLSTYSSLLSNDAMSVMAKTNLQQDEKKPLLVPSLDHSNATTCTLESWLPVLLDSQKCKLYDDTTTIINTNNCLFPPHLPVAVAGKGRPGTFLQKLYQMLIDLEKAPGGTQIASFIFDGRAFAIHKPKEFVATVIPKYFHMTSFASFQRQLNMYKFQQVAVGPNRGAYYHEFFVRGQPHLYARMTRIRNTNKRKK